jgi:hypothetical protein
MTLHFVAYAATDGIHAETIAAAATAATTLDLTYRTWSQQDRSGAPLGESVETWIDEAEAVVADITFVNDNVKYEIGYALGARKRLRLIRNETVPITELKAIGLLDTLLRDPFRTLADLIQVLINREAPINAWHMAERDRKQPVYVLTPPTPSQFSTSLLSAVKKQGKQKFRSFNVREIARLTAQDAWHQAVASFGIVATWQDTSDLEARRNNQRAAFLAGIGRGLGIPVLLIAHTRSVLPADLADEAVRIGSDAELPDSSAHLP